MKFSIITLGCKVNTYESEAMKELLLNNSFAYDEDYQNSDIIIVNTCSVTNQADIKSKKLLRRLKRENPNCILMACGCSIQNNIDDYKDLDIDILIGNKDKSRVVELINNFVASKERYVDVTKNRNLPFESMKVNKFTSHTRAFLKVQDGCDNFCSYCIIPYVRGTIRSKKFQECLKEATILVNHGHRELVLTGIHTGSYNDSGHDLTDLIHELSLIPKLERIRISSIEITELNEKFLEELKANTKICNHIHIPLQNGSNYILAKMNRKYNCDYFKDKINKIREIRPDISITTDVIVGFPYEDEELFMENYNFCKLINFAKIHVFPYSIRTGTVASKMPYQVDPKDKKERAARLIALSEELEKEYAISHINQTIDVLIEEIFDGYSIGHTSNYLKVKINKEYNQSDLITVKVVDYKDGLLIGE